MQDQHIIQKRPQRGRCILLNQERKGTFYMLDKRNSHVLKFACRRTINSSGKFKNEYGVEYNIDLLVGICMVNIKFGSDAVLMLFYRTITCYADVQEILKRDGLKELFNKAFLICHDGQVYVGHHRTGKNLQSAVIANMPPKIWALLQNPEA